MPRPDPTSPDAQAAQNAKSPLSDDRLNSVRRFLQDLQRDIINALNDQEAQGGADGASEARFVLDPWTRPEGGGGVAAVLSGGQVIEKAGVMFSDIRLSSLPATASARYPQLAGASAAAMGVSLVVHPKNPHVPTSHANVRFFVAYPKNADPVGWFGGGFDLTPFYPNLADVRHWHQVAFDLCAPFGDKTYQKYKNWCDDYFYLPHRGESRGVGGLFFDDLSAADFEKNFAFMQAVGRGYLAGILPIFERNKRAPYTQKQRDFQLYRRGRYVEFNLLYDRGTLFGLQSGGRAESILVSMPPLASWQYGYAPPDGSDEARLADFLRPQEWLGDTPNPKTLAHLERTQQEFARGDFEVFDDVKALSKAAKDAAHK